MRLTVLRSTLPNILRSVVVENVCYRIDGDKYGEFCELEDYYEYKGTKDAEGRPEWIRYLRCSSRWDEPSDNAFDGSLESLERALLDFGIQVLDEPIPTSKYKGRTYTQVQDGNIAGKKIVATASGCVLGQYGNEPCTYLYFDDDTYHAFVHPSDDD